MTNALEEIVNQMLGPGAAFSDLWTMRLRVMGALAYNRRGYRKRRLMKTLGLRLVPSVAKQVDEALCWLQERGAVQHDADTGRWFSIEVRPHTEGRPGCSVDFALALEGAEAAQITAEQWKARYA